jgi:hypothetical protein
MTNENNILPLKAMAKEALDLLNSRFVVSEANKEITTTMVRLAEAVAYGSPRTPKRVHHHGIDDESGLPSLEQQRVERENALAKLSPSEKRALGLPG